MFETRDYELYADFIEDFKVALLENIRTKKEYKQIVFNRFMINGWNCDLDLRELVKTNDLLDAILREGFRYSETSSTTDELVFLPIDRRQ